MESALARAIQAAREASLTEEEWAAGEGGGGGGGNKRRRNGRDRGGNKGGDKRKRLDQCAKAWAKLIVEDLQRDDGNGEEAALCACESILSAAASADMRSNKVNLSHFSASGSDFQPSTLGYGGRGGGGNFDFVREFDVGGTHPIQEGQSVSFVGGVVHPGKLSPRC